MPAKFLTLTGLRRENYENLLPRPHYTSMPKYPKGVEGDIGEGNVLGHRNDMFCLRWFS
jgi:hypothetical protein